MERIARGNKRQELLALRWLRTGVPKGIGKAEEEITHHTLMLIFATGLLPYFHLLEERASSSDTASDQIQPQKYLACLVWSFWLEDLVVSFCKSTAQPAELFCSLY